MAYIPHTPAYTEKCKPCLLCDIFGARSSSGTDHNISRKECVTVVNAWGTCGARERCLGWWYRGMRRNTFSRTSTEMEALLDLWMSLEPRFRHTCDDAQEENSPLYRTGSNILPLPCATFHPPSHTSTVQISGPSNLGVKLKADASTFEYEGHRACLSVKTSTDESSHVPLHARTLRGAVLSS